MPTICSTRCRQWTVKHVVNMVKGAHMRCCLRPQQILQEKVGGKHDSRKSTGPICLRTSLLRTCSDLQLDGLINPTAVAGAMLDQCALVIFPSHAFDLPASYHTGKLPMLVYSRSTSRFSSYTARQLKQQCVLGQCKLIVQTGRASAYQMTIMHGKPTGCETYIDSTAHAPRLQDVR